MLNFVNNKINIKKILLFIFIYFIFLFFNNVYASTTLSNKELYCNSDLVMDFESGNILFEKNGYKKVYPASTTKILTALLAIEKLDLNSSVVASKNAVYSTPIGSSVIYIKPEEIMSVKDLLYGLLVKSGNDAANVLAEAVSGNMDDFIKLMNEKLQDIGCYNTHFTNAHGFHDDNHYTTVYDMAILMRYTMKNDIFREIVETKNYTIEATNKSDKRIYKNTNKMFNENYEKMYYEYVLGGKTGYTEEARGTFVGYGKKDDKLVIVCAFDGSQNINKQEGRFLDSITLFEYAFNNFNKYKILDNNTYRFKIKDSNYNEEYTLGINDELFALFKNDFYSSNYEINLNVSDISNIDINEAVGTITIQNKGKSLNTKNSYELILLKKNNYFDISDIYKYVDILSVIILLFILIILIKKLTLLKRNRKITYNKTKSKKISRLK